jgi:signal transduction histidine kinase
VGENRSKEVPQAAAEPIGSPFSRNLNLQIRRVEIFLFLLVGVIMLAPVSVFIMLELDRLRDDARSQAQECATLVTAAAADSDLDLEQLTKLLETQTRIDNRIVGVSVLGDEGEALITIGEPADSSGRAREEVPLPPSAAPLRKVQVSIARASLLPSVARVFAIHFLVAVLLGLAIEKFAVRALHRAFQSLDATQAQLLHAEKLSALGEVYAGLAHEINNPLGIILTRVKLLRTGPDGPPELDRDLEMIERHGTRIAQIIRGLLAFARKTSFRVGETDLNQVIEEVVTLVSRSS